MKRVVLISLAIIAATSFAFASQATAKEKSKTVTEEKKLKKIEDTGAFLGIYMGELDDDARKDADYPKSSGVLVTNVIEDSPAEEAGIEEGDIIYLFDDETVESGKQLGELVSSHKPGDSVEIVLYRDGKKKTVDVALAEKKTSYVTIDIDDEDLANSYMIMKKLGEPGVATVFGKDGRWSFMTDRAVLGVSLHELSKDLAPYFDVKAGEGVLVLDVYDDTPAAEAGIKDGDVIVEIGGAKVSKYDDVADALEEVEEDTTVTVTVVRNGKKLDVPVEVERGGVYSMGMYQPAVDKALKDFKYNYNVRIPEMKAMRFKDVEQQKLEQRMKELEKQLEELQEKLKKMDKTD